MREPIGNKRGDGTTTKQMLAAPADALFVWCNDHTYYPVRLARRLGRTDLTIIGLGQFDRDHIEGRTRSVVIDYYASLSPEQEELYRMSLRFASAS